MNHDDSDKRFYVYVHKDEYGNIRYVGQGSRFRYNCKQGRSQEHLEMFSKLTKEIVKSGLSKSEALELELEMYNEFVLSGLLFNKRKPGKINEISYEYLNQFLEYNEDSPTCLIWKNCSKYKSELQGKEAGSTHSTTGYLTVKLLGKTLKSHRVIYVLCTKQDLNSNLYIDHIDGNPSNNVFSNLRLVTPRENNFNRKNSVPKGVFFDKNHNAWRAVWSDGFAQIRKSFPLVKLSKENPDLTSEQINELSFTLACEHRNKMEHQYHIIEDRESTLGPASR